MVFYMMEFILFIVFGFIRSFHCLGHDTMKCSVYLTEKAGGMFLWKEKDLLVSGFHHRNKI